jgi:hypothetical protein
MSVKVDGGARAETFVYKIDLYKVFLSQNGEIWVS